MECLFYGVLNSSCRETLKKRVKTIDEGGKTNILARLGVGVKESENMLGHGDSKETQVVVESSSSDANAEVETPLSSVSAGRV
jgi:hypothetical protein